MTTVGTPPVCRNCGREIEDGKLDQEGWCAQCRRGVIRRATLSAIAFGALVAVVYLAGMAWAGGFASVFMIFLLALGAILVYVAFKVARRVAFDLVRARAMRATAR
ncbi:MAG TPA: hypothetical protein VHG28_15870 [Longimicrobiaceae bacterium]|nr:hypothetical protein [Longimicrobiaceae bacterium]